MGQPYGTKVPKSFENSRVLFRKHKEKLGIDVLRHRRAGWEGKPYEVHTPYWSSKNSTSAESWTGGAAKAERAS